MDNKEWSKYDKLNKLENELDDIKKKQKDMDEPNISAIIVAFIIVVIFLYKIFYHA